MDFNINSNIRRMKAIANILPKIDMLGPEIEYKPKKITINKPLPDLKQVTPKVDNEGLQIVHLPKEVKVHKGTPKFENLRSRVDNKGIDILHGQNQKTEKVLHMKKDTLDAGEKYTEDDIDDDHEDRESPEDDEDMFISPPERNQLDNISDKIFGPIIEPKQTEVLMSPLHLSVLSRVPTPSSSSTSDASLPPTPRSAYSKNSLQRLFTLASRRPSHQITPTEDPTPKPLTPRSRVPTPPTQTPSPKPRLPTPPESPELILKPSYLPPAKVKTPTPPPSKLIQVSPVHNQDLFVQTDSIDKLDEFNQTDFKEPEKTSSWKWWQILIIILILLILFIGIGLAIGYAVGFFGSSQLNCSDGFVEVNNLCQAISTTTTTTTAPCDGCNCPQDISLDPDDPSISSVEIMSPRYPQKYRHNSDCTWNIFASRGQLELTFSDFNIEWAQNCRDKDFVFLDQVQNYGRMWLCGPFLPQSFLTQTSKYRRMTVKFKSNGSVTRRGFQAVVVATGTGTPDIENILDEQVQTIQKEDTTTQGFTDHYSSKNESSSLITIL